MENQKKNSSFLKLKGLYSNQLDEHQKKNSKQEIKDFIKMDLNSNQKKIINFLKKNKYQNSTQIRNFIKLNNNMIDKEIKNLITKGYIDFVTTKNAGKRGRPSKLYHLKSKILKKSNNE